MSDIKHHRVTYVSALLVVGFLLLFALNPEAFSALVDTTYAWSATHFGLFWQVFMLANFVIALVVATHPGAQRRLGNLDEPEFPTFQWVAMILCTLLAGGGVF
ncbi:MAG: BCCT family transporter, partial [Halieaceae bacterium]